MGADRDIPPYALSARHATDLAARRTVDERMRAAVHDAEHLQQLGLRAIKRSRRGLVLSVIVALAAAAASVALLVVFWNGESQSDAGVTRAAWSLLGGTASLGVVYLAGGGIERAARRRHAGQRLLLRAKRQRERSQT